MWARYDRGLLIIAVSSNDFGGQEPGGPSKSTRPHGEYGVSFPLAAKADVKGPSAHPFYKWALHSVPATAALELHKYLIGRDGLLAAVFSTQTEPTDPRVIAAIEKELR